MPNRIIKESICVSKTLNKLSWFEEVCFYRLIVTVDDFGRYFADPEILKGKLFPRANCTEDQIARAIIGLASAGILSTYKVEDEAYLQILTWTKHQTIRAKKSKFPPPPDLCNLSDLQADESNRNQARANVPVFVNEFENVNENGNVIRDVCTEPVPDSVPEEKKVVIELPLNDKSLWAVVDSQIDEWRNLYPAVDIEQELRKMKGWLDANPDRRKTSRGIKRFCNGWLSREQDRGCVTPRNSNGKISSAIGNFAQRKYSDKELDGLVYVPGMEVTNETNT